MKQFVRFFILGILCTFLGSLNMAAKKKPDWVKQRPSDPAYYIGIATVPKSGNALEYRQAARGAALKQMSSEIKVNISSNSVFQTIETDFQYKQAYESKIQASVQQTLEGYEVLTWENRKTYWVMTRLSKQKYARARQMKLDKAKMIASAYLSDAREAIGNYNPYSALSFLTKGVLSLKDHLEEDLTYKTVDGTINVGTALFSTIQEVFRRIRLEPVQSHYQIQFSRKLAVPMGINASFVGPKGTKRSLSRLPLKFTFTKGEGLLTAQNHTNPEGYAAVSVTRLISKRKMQEIVAAFDFDPAAEANGDEEAKRLLAIFFPAKQIPAATIRLEVMKSKAYLIGDEVVFGDVDGQAVLTTMLKTELNENFFTFTNRMDQADFVVKLRSNFVAGDERKGQGYSVFIVFADLNISIQDVASKTEVFTDHLTGIRGMRPGNIEYALKDARGKLLATFKKEVAPRLEQVDM